MSDNIFKGNPERASGAPLITTILCRRASGPVLDWRWVVFKSCTAWRTQRDQAESCGTMSRTRKTQA